MKLLLILFGITILLSGCTQTKEIRTIETVEKDPSNPEGPIGSGGGGNTVDGIPFENYIFHIEEREEYKKFILPILNNLSHSFPELAADFMHISQHRKWYMMPVTLEQIPNERLGIYAKTKDQLALQNTKEIFIDQTLFDPMPSIRDKGTLLLHELVMGVWFMKNQDFYDLCLGWASSQLIPTISPELSKYQDFEAECRKQALLHGHEDVAIRKIKLPEEADYQQIRKMTQEIEEKTGQIDGAAYKDLMKIYGVREYKNPIDNSEY